MLYFVALYTSDIVSYCCLKNNFFTNISAIATRNLLILQLSNWFNSDSVSPLPFIVNIVTFLVIFH